MNMGLGFTEILLILALILVFFGSKELPLFIREIAKWTAKARHYSDKIRNEFDQISRSMEPGVDYVADANRQKVVVRAKYLAIRKNIDPAVRESLSKEICARMLASGEYAKSRAIMTYIGSGSEVLTRDLARRALVDGKRVAIPYCKPNGEMGIGAIQDVEADLVLGARKTWEPRPELWDNLLKSDVDLVVCPGVAFDKQGRRLGRGKAYYDRFLIEFKGRIPIVGLAFDCQMSEEFLPFEYCDVLMDQIHTEKGTHLAIIPVEQSPVTEPDSSLPVEQASVADSDRPDPVEQASVADSDRPDPVAQPEKPPSV